MGPPPRRPPGARGARRRSARTTGPRSTLRYLDALPVPEVAELLGRSTTATEALLVRAKAAFRRAYDGGDDA